MWSPKSDCLWAIWKGTPTSNWPMSCQKPMDPSMKGSLVHVLKVGHWNRMWKQKNNFVHFLFVFKHYFS